MVDAAIASIIVSFKPDIIVTHARRQLQQSKSFGLVILVKGPIPSQTNHLVSPFFPFKGLYCLLPCIDTW